MLRRLKLEQDWCLVQCMTPKVPVAQACLSVLLCMSTSEVFQFLFMVTSRLGEFFVPFTEDFCSF